MTQILLHLTLVFIGFMANSCKRERVDNISALFSSGYWQLASLSTTRYIGDNQLSTTIDSCNLTQKFTFNNDNTCTFTNFGCDSNNINGTWNITDARTYLTANIIAPDSTGKDYQPFINSRIVNLGDYSLVLETGDIQTYYTATDKRTIFRWGFVRVKTSTK
ncbi:MAG: hypothetical protein EOP45_12745 [Sphingobacteriaceae bacterium]|nr:MAG: hypothetical protein EOP45_12745 [Sphingobacteriaceae bacterium]